ncbi:Phospholipase A2 group XV [Halotydeus destructor]|nr:Phospholipase A2 group XV [Halotydeus destructor]
MLVRKKLVTCCLCLSLLISSVLGVSVSKGRTRRDIQDGVVRLDEVDVQPEQEGDTNSVNHGHAYQTTPPKRSPVILVPGDGGSQLFAKLDKPDVVHYFCDRKTENYFSLWLNLALLVPFVIDCWVDNMKLVYDNTTRKTSNAPGVDILVPAFGNTSSVEYVDPSQVSVTGYYNILVNRFVAAGYTRGVDIRGAPYDFRKSPTELDDYYARFKSLVEDTYKTNISQPGLLNALDQFWDHDEVILRNGDKSYTTSNYQELFEDIDYPVGYNMWLDTRNLTYKLEAPGVEVHCLHGVGVHTMEHLDYSGDKFPDQQPKIDFGDGDGTVNTRSLRGCLRWQGQQEQPVNYANFSGVDHMSVMTDSNVINYLLAHAMQ